MPFLSISRDKRGYETVSLLHLAGGRRGSVKPKLLYWFRTPPDVRVGATLFCDQVRRSLEQRHRDLTFDWPRILAGGVPEPAETAGAAAPAGREVAVSRKRAKGKRRAREGSAPVCGV